MPSGATTSDSLFAAVDAGDPVAARALVDAIPDALLVHDEHGTLLEANRSACTLYGYARDDLLALNLFALNPGLHTGQLHDLLQDCAALTIETLARHRDGRDIPIELHCSGHQGADGARIVSVARNVGHWQRTTDRLRETEQRDRVLLNSLEAGVIVRDSNGLIEYANPAAYRMFRIEPSELHRVERDGYPGWRFANANGEILLRQELPSVRVLDTGVAITSELVCYWLPHADMPLWAYVSATPMFRSGETRPYQVVATLSDVTHLKRTQDLLEQTQELGNIGGFELILGNQQVVWTRQMYRLFDLSEEFPLTLDRLLALFTPESRLRVERDMEQAAAGQQHGRKEYEIVTPLGRRRWISAISHPVWRGDEVASLTGCCQDITERKQLEQELRRKAATDPLTGLPNRESIVGELELRIPVSGSQGGPALLYVDLDRFKTINSVLGADVGDRLLAGAASRLRACLPAGAQCGRFASDEFLVVLPRVAGADDAAEAINRAFRDPFQDGDEEFLMTASVGIARYPGDGRTAAQLLKHADAAMDEAKQNGRNTWQAFSPSAESPLGNSLAIESQLRHALRNHELRLAYQPQVELASGRVIGAEALLRWQHPQHGELLPLEFVRHAESNGEIVPIGAWTIDESCRQLRTWRDAGLRIERIAVNVSCRQLLSESFAGCVDRALRRHRLDGGSLELEMIERMLIADTPTTLQVFKELRDLGVAITIDDFGEGYSALNYLRRLPIDGFKISYEFMRRVPSDPVDAAICEALIRLGRALGLGIVAEGIETEEQRAFLLQQGMRVGQGHLFSEALTAEAFAAFAQACD